MVYASLILKNNGTAVQAIQSDLTGVDLPLFNSGLIKKDDWYMYIKRSQVVPGLQCIPLNAHIIKALKQIKEIKFEFEDCQTFEDEVYNLYSRYKYPKDTAEIDDPIYPTTAQEKDLTFADMISLQDRFNFAGVNIHNFNDVIDAFVMYCLYDGAVGHLPYDRDQEFRLPAIKQVIINGKPDTCFSDLKKYIDSTFYKDGANVIVYSTHGKLQWYQSDSWKYDKSVICTYEKVRDCNGVCLQLNRKFAKRLHKITMVELHLGVLQNQYRDNSSQRDWATDEWFIQRNDYDAIVILLMAAPYITSAYINKESIRQMHPASTQLIAQIQCHYLSEKHEGIMPTPVYSVDINQRIQTDFLYIVLNILMDKKTWRIMAYDR